VTFKYLITIKGCILFAPTIPHDKIVAGNVKILSAGFVRIQISAGEVDFHCYGRSESLDIDSRPDADAMHIRLWGSLL